MVVMPGPRTAATACIDAPRRTPGWAACGAGSPATAAGSRPLARGAVLAPSGSGWGRVAEPRKQMARSGSGATFLGRDKEHLRPA